MLGSSLAGLFVAASMATSGLYVSPELSTEPGVAMPSIGYQSNPAIAIGNAGVGLVA